MFDLFFSSAMNSLEMEKKCSGSGEKCRENSVCRRTNIWEMLFISGQSPFCDKASNTVFILVSWSDETWQSRMFSVLRDISLQKILEYRIPGILKKDK